mmetsp:Transcript_3479/g.7102  ORF Transcript_3479/g.7102 Transcript_3479/m.7102 type:complete len:80 (+) Transcript_3479:3-242(+)
MWENRDVFQVYFRTARREKAAEAGLPVEETEEPEQANYLQAIWDRCESEKDGPTPHLFLQEFVKNPDRAADLQKGVLRR